jgi:hypothetical protein
VQRWTFFLCVTILFRAAICFGQTTQPSTQPTNLDPTAALQAQQDRVKNTFDQSSDGQALLGEIASAQKGLDDAKVDGSPMVVNIAAANVLTIKSTYVRALNAAYAADPGVQAAQAAVAQAAAVPDLNNQIVKFAIEHIGSQVGDGECVTLAEEAMKSANATHPGTYVWGRALGPNDTVFPGDIIQFTSVRLQSGTGGIDLGDPNHTAIIRTVISPGVYDILHQNFGMSGKVVSELTIDLSTKTAGQYVIYRPGPDAGAAGSK